MKVVKSIEVIESKRDFYEIMNFGACPDYARRVEFPDITAGEMEITEEFIQGRRFVNQHGEQIVIGWAKDVQNVLGLPFEAFENQNNEISDLRSECQRLEDDFKNLNETIEKSTFAQRIKFLFTRKL